MAKTPALSEVTKIGNITVDGEGRLNVVTDTSIMRGDQVVAGPTHHHHIVDPGADLTNEDPKVVAIANATWTEEVIVAFRLAHPLPTVPLEEVVASEQAPTDEAK